MIVITCSFFPLFSVRKHSIRRWRRCRVTNSGHYMIDIGLSKERGRQVAISYIPSMPFISFLVFPQPGATTVRSSMTQHMSLQADITFVNNKLTHWNFYFQKSSDVMQRRYIKRTLYLSFKLKWWRFLLT